MKGERGTAGFDGRQVSSMILIFLCCSKVFFSFNVCIMRMCILKGSDGLRGLPGDNGYPGETGDIVSIIYDSLLQIILLK